MRCECCDKELNDSEATARFVGDPKSPTRYVGMCAECRSFLPPEVKYTVRRDLPNDKGEKDGSWHEDYWDLGDMDDESW